MKLIEIGNCITESQLDDMFDSGDFPRQGASLALALSTKETALKHQITAMGDNHTKLERSLSGYAPYYKFPGGSSQIAKEIADGNKISGSKYGDWCCDNTPENAMIIKRMASIRERQVGIKAMVKKIHSKRLRVERENRKNGIS